MIYWKVPFSSLHASIVSSGAPMQKIDSQFDSLVQSVAFFASPNEASRKIVMEQSGTQFDVSSRLSLSQIASHADNHANQHQGEEICH